MPTDGIFDTFVKMAATAGPLGTVIMGIIAWLSYKERRQKDVLILELTRSGIKAMNGVASSLKSIHEKLDGGRRRRRR